MTNENIAQVCHETNRAYCQVLGDFSQPSWADAALWQKDSAIHGVEAVLANPSQTPRQSHEGWLAEKQATGWVYGSQKDPWAKTHPCVVPYDVLPLEQRVKDRLFVAVVRALVDEV